VSDREVSHSDLVETAKRTGLQEELRRSRRGYSLLALDKCSAASIVLVASLDGGCRECSRLLVAMN
jgi:hypothetical protein